MSQQKMKGSRNKAATVARAFWVRHFTKELDKSGDWILSNLKQIRKEAVTGADSI